MLQCDACYHREPIEKLHKNLIGKPCPVCQSNMLTKEDYRIARRVQWRIRLLEFFGIIRAPEQSDPEVHFVRVQAKDGRTHMMDFPIPNRQRDI